MVAEQTLLHDPPAQLLSVHPCWVMRLFDWGLMQSPLERQVSPLLQHDVAVPVFAPGAAQGS